MSEDNGFSRRAKTTSRKRPTHRASEPRPLQWEAAFKLASQRGDKPRSAPRPAVGSVAKAENAPVDVRRDEAGGQRLRRLVREADAKLVAAWFEDLDRKRI